MRAGNISESGGGRPSRKSRSAASDTAASAAAPPRIGYGGSYTCGVELPTQERDCACSNACICRTRPTDAPGVLEVSFGCCGKLSRGVSSRWKQTPQRAPRRLRSALTTHLRAFVAGNAAITCGPPSVAARHPCVQRSLARWVSSVQGQLTRCRCSQTCLRACCQTF